MVLALPVSNCHYKFVTLPGSILAAVPSADFILMCLFYDNVTQCCVYGCKQYLLFVNCHPLHIYKMTYMMEQKVVFTIYQSLCDQ